jgi:hypothetical protein
MDEVPSASQIKHDKHALHGILLSSFQGGLGRRISMEKRKKQDDIRAWYQSANQYETDGKGMLQSKSLKTSLLQYSIEITREG